MRLISLAGLLALASASANDAKQPTYQKLPTLRDQASLQNKWVAERKEAIPDLLAKHSMDAWLVRNFFFSLLLSFLLLTLSIR